MSHYRKKPVVIEAFQYDGTVSSADAMGQWGGTEPNGDGTFRHRIGQRGQFGPLVIHTLEGEMTAQVGDWIIKGVKGEFYPCKPDIFDLTYEPASPERPVVPSDAEIKRAANAAQRAYYEYDDIWEPQKWELAVRAVLESIPLHAARAIPREDAKT